MELLQVSVQEIFRASVMAEVDVVSRPLAQLLESAKEQASSMSTLVPPAFYLPAPPLYCPQPAPNTQVHLRSYMSSVQLVYKIVGLYQRGYRVKAMSSSNEADLITGQIRSYVFAT